MKAKNEKARRASKSESMQQCAVFLAETSSEVPSQKRKEDAEKALYLNRI